MLSGRESKARLRGTAPHNALEGSGRVRTLNERLTTSIVGRDADTTKGAEVPDSHTFPSPRNSTSAL